IGIMKPTLNLYHLSLKIGIKINPKQAPQYPFSIKPKGQKSFSELSKNKASHPKTLRLPEKYIRKLLS
ncbi:hypothetical protein BC833DRAFT_586770, partial [Globomyces pollinis-pini]